MREDLEEILETNKRLADTINTLHPECVFEDIPLGQIYKGREGATEYYQTLVECFRDYSKTQQLIFSTTLFIPAAVYADC